jgi:hypothetical protein
MPISSEVFVISSKFCDHLEWATISPFQFFSIHNPIQKYKTYEGVSKSFRTVRLERELQIVQLSITRCSCIDVLWVSLVSFASVTLWRGQQWVIQKVRVHFVIDSVRKLLDTPSYVLKQTLNKLRSNKKCVSHTKFYRAGWISGNAQEACRMNLVPTSTGLVAIFGGGFRGFSQSFQLMLG